MKVDTDSFQNQVTFVEPGQIMMVDIIEDVNPRYLRNPIAKENMNKDLNEFENEVKGVFPRA